MHVLDIVIAVCFIPGLVRGLSKGFLEQVLCLAGVILGVWAAFRFSGLVCTWLKPYLDISETVLNVVAFALILVAAAYGALLLAKLLTRIVEMALLGWLDRSLGLVFACLVTALVLSVVIILFDTLNVKFALVPEDTLGQSILYGPLKDLGYFVFPYLKELLLKQ
ncbi:MAG: CvpA family protein [Bacteroidales bacterium]|nr:CvpA family protein [Bacteroidales bacterium]